MGRPWPRSWCRPWPTLWHTGGQFFQSSAQHCCKPVCSINLSYLRLSSVLLAAFCSHFLSRLMVDGNQRNQDAIQTQLLMNYRTKEQLLQSTFREFPRTEAAHSVQIGSQFVSCLNPCSTRSLISTRARKLRAIPPSRR